MKLIIAGSRTVYPTLAEIDAAFDDLLFVKADVECVVSGKCPSGADHAGEAWAVANGIRVEPFPADWDEHGKAAGKMRNREMAVFAHGALVFWDGMSSGSADMVTRMVARGKPVRVIPSPRRRTP